MINFIENLKAKSCKLNRGMTYVELIVVLSIFGTMSSVVLFNYREFQTKVDIKNLASDVALKIVEAQKASVSGKLPPQVPPRDTNSNWKPSYGIYFRSDADLDSSDNIYFNKKFIYFVDLNNDNGYEAELEKLDTITITKGNYVESVGGCTDTPCSTFVPITSLAVIFKRPDSGVTFKDSSGATLANDFDYIKITIASEQSPTIKSNIKVYPSGRIQVN